MAHTFFEKNSNFQVEENFDIDQFVVEVSWAPDSTQLELVFDPSEDYFPELQEKLATGEWEHFVLKVAAYYDGREMAVDYLGSIVHESPAKWIEEDLDGQVDEMVHKVVDEARNEALRMLDILKQDFLEA
jgi:serine protease inhibitor